MRLANPSMDLEQPVRQVELHLAELHEALKTGDTMALEVASTALHRALTGAVAHFRTAAQQGAVPAPLRERLALASAQVAAQRQALARATASLDRAIDVLLPARAQVYGANGQGSRMSRSACLSA